MFRMIKSSILLRATHGDTPFWVAILLVKIPNALLLLKTKI